MPPWCAYKQEQIRYRHSAATPKENKIPKHMLKQTPVDAFPWGSILSIQKWLFNHKITRFLCLLAPILVEVHQVVRDLAGTVLADVHVGQCADGSGMVRPGGLLYGRGSVRPKIDRNDESTLWALR